MKTVMDSVNEITPGLHGRARRKRVVPPRTAVMADSRRRAPKAVLPETGRFQYHTPVQGDTSTRHPPRCEYKLRGHGHAMARYPTDAMRHTTRHDPDSMAGATLSLEGGRGDTVRIRTLSMSATRSALTDLSSCWLLL